MSLIIISIAIIAIILLDSLYALIITHKNHKDSKLYHHELKDLRHYLHKYYRNFNIDDTSNPINTIVYCEHIYNDLPYSIKMKWNAWLLDNRNLIEPYIKNRIYKQFVTLSSTDMTVFNKILSTRLLELADNVNNTGEMDNLSIPDEGISKLINRINELDY